MVNRESEAALLLSSAHWTPCLEDNMFVRARACVCVCVCVCVYSQRSYKFANTKALSCLRYLTPHRELRFGVGHGIFVIYLEIRKQYN